jgi:hypothetical protein
MGCPNQASLRASVAAVFGRPAFRFCGVRDAGEVKSAMFD